MQSGGQKVKVCFVITKGVWGGAGKYVWSLAKSLPKDRFEVSVITGEGETLKNRLEEEGIKTYVLPSLKRDVSALRELRSFLALYRTIRKISPDVLHLNSPKASGLGAVAGRLLFVPKIVQTVHGFTWNEERPEWEKGLITFFTWITLLLCHKTIVLSSKEQRQARNLILVRDTKIVLIKNGVEQILFKAKEEAREKLTALSQKNPSSDAIWIGTLSELHKNKGLEFIIAALSKIKQPFSFFIIGAGEEKSNLEQMIKKCGLEEKVFLLGFVSRANEYLKAFDIFTLTSIKEGLPYALLEAGLAEMPVIASNIGGIPDIVENSVSGILTTKGRAGEITRALDYLIENPDKRDLYGKNLKQKVDKEFSIEQMIENTIELYT